MDWSTLALASTTCTAGCLLLLRFFAADVYDIVIVWMTARWYEYVFQKLSKGDRVLDIGIGTATALAKNKAAIFEKRLAVVGLDYEASYVQKAESILKAEGLLRPVPAGTEGYRPRDFYCRVFERSVYDDDLANLCGDEPSRRGLAPGQTDFSVPEAQRFDAAYFSGSITLMPDPAAALRAVAPLIKKESGRVYITQTFEKKHSSIKAVVKPLMKYVTTIDFGQLTTEARLHEIIAEAKIFDTVECGPIPGSMDNMWQTARLIVLRLKPEHQ